MFLRGFKRKVFNIFAMVVILLPYFLSIPIVKAETDWTGYTPISSKADLDNIRNNLSGKYYLTADIVFTAEDFAEGGAFYKGGSGWNPIGIDSSNAFSGILDGNGHTINNLYCNASSASAGVYAGLFGYSRGTIQNLGIVNSNIKGNSTSSNYAYVGGISGYNAGKIINVYNTGSVVGPLSSSNYSYVGGVVGYSTGPITNSYNTGEVIGSDSSSAYTGGIAGYSYGTIANSNNAGSVSGYYTGGIVGYYSSGTINNCYNTGTLRGWVIGGIVGYNSSGTISRCYNTSGISSSRSSQVGGIVGASYNGIINNCYNSGSVNGHYSGGIVGYSMSNISNCYNIGLVSGDNAGGTVGTNYLGTIVNCYYMDIISTGVGDYSGISTPLNSNQMQNQSSFIDFDFTDTWIIDNNVSYKFPTLKDVPHVEMENNIEDFNGGNGTVYNPYKIATKEQLDKVRNDLTASYILTANIVFTDNDFSQGGAFYNEGIGWRPIGTDSSNPYAGTFDGNGFTISGIVCNVSSTAIGYVYAGLFGYNNGVIRNLGMVDNTITANFSGSSGSAYETYSGGIAGQNNGNISNCYNTGSVSSYANNLRAYSGGVAGWNIGTISKCYNTGKIVGQISGGISGKNRESISNCYNTGISVNGIVGINDYGSISNCYNTGNVSGFGIAFGNFNNCYYLNNISTGNGSGSDTSSALTIDQMKNQTSYVGFDFTNVWIIDSNKDYKLPTLRGMTVVNNKTVTSISIHKLPLKTSYIRWESLDLTGAQILVKYNDGSEDKIVNVTSDMVDFNPTMIGEQTITVTFGDQFATFMVNVVGFFNFNSNGGTAVESQWVGFDNLLSVPTNPTRNGYTFGGWYKEASCINGWNFAIDRVTDITTLYAKWIVAPLSVSYQGHVQNIGWQDYVRDGDLSGTEGESLRVEGFKIRLENAPAGLHIKYKTHVQNVGWQDWVYDDAMAGTQGQSLRVEALQIMLEGIDSEKYSIQYQAHVQNEGWQRWVKDGEISGSFGKSQRIEALRIKITEKLPSVSYQGHVQNIGWQDFVKDGALAGTEGRSLRVEGFKIKLEDAPEGLHIKYKTHVQNIGWQDWVYDDTMAGTQGQSLRVEALQIMLEGIDSEKYSIQYQAHVQNEGWQRWVKDGEISGSFGKSQRIEALRIKITVKLPSVSYQGHVQNIGWQDNVKDGALAGTEGRSLRVEGFKIKLENAPEGLHIKYKSHVQNIGWQDWVYDGEMAGTQGESLRVEALQIMLEGTDAEKYSIEYQAHVQNEGWQPWVKDGEISGSFGKSQRIEAVRIYIVKK